MAGYFEKMEQFDEDRKRQAKVDSDNKIPRCIVVSDENGVQFVIIRPMFKGLESMTEAVTECLEQAKKNSMLDWNWSDVRKNLEQRRITTHSAHELNFNE